MSTRSSARNLFPPLDNPELTIQRRSCFDPTLLNNSKMAAEGNDDLPVPDLRTMEELYQPSLNGRGGTFMKRRPEECYDLIKNMTAHHNDWDTSAQRSESSSSITSSSDMEITALKTEMAEINKNLMRVLQVNQQVKAVAPNCEICGGPYSFSDCPSTVGNTQNVYAAGAYQVISPIIEPVAYPVNAPRPNQIPSIPYPSRLHDQKLRDKANDQQEIFFQIFKDLNFNINFTDALILMPKFGPSIKSLLTNMVKLCKLTRTPLNEHYSAVLLKKLPEKLGDPGKFLISCDFPGMAECLALADLGASINLMPLSVWNKLPFPDLSPTCMTLELADRSISRPTSRYSANYNDKTANRIDVIDMACEEYSQEVLGFSNVIASDSPTPYYDPIVSTTSPTLTPFGESDFLLVEFDEFLALEDDPTSPKVDQSYVDTEGDILLLKAFLNDDPSLPPPNQGNYLPQVRKELKICEAKSDKSSIDEPPEVELKDLPPHLEYAFLKGDDKFPVIIAKDLSVEEKTTLITVLKSHKRAIAWKLSDIKGIDPEFYTHKILMEEYFEPVGGFTVVENEKNKLILTPLVMRWRVCVDYPDFVVVDFEPDPLVPLILGRCFLKTGHALIDVHKGELTLRIKNEAITYNLDQTVRYYANYNQMTANKINVICEMYSQEVLGFSDTTASGNPTRHDDPIVSTTSPTLTLFGDSDFLLFEESGVFSDLPPHLEYAFLKGDDKFPVIIAKDLSVEEKTTLITVLKSHKRAIAWKLSDIKGIDPEFYTHKILMEEYFEPVVQHQRRVNPKIHDVIKQDVLKLLDAGLIYPISDSPWVSPVHCVPRKGGFTVVENEKNKLILTPLVMRWRVCVDYRKLNEATRQDHFPLPFMDQM
nr:reverse transcriptase domain-containing protein [Tanacetum cinerariifolium]